VLTLILLVFGLVFFILAGFGFPYGTPNPPNLFSRVNLIGLGLACWIGAEVIVRLNEVYKLPH
jgi:hypothetical protein